MSLVAEWVCIRAQSVGRSDNRGAVSWPVRGLHIPSPPPPPPSLRDSGGGATPRRIVLSLRDKVRECGL